MIPADKMPESESKAKHNDSRWNSHASARMSYMKQKYIQRISHTKSKYILYVHQYFSVAITTPRKSYYKNTIHFNVTYSSTYMSL
ncbi:MAG: hypothetical protein ALMCE001_19540 [Methanocorpusculum sp. MCE]|nr:MAG: hypothetical protein ALMCE001_19540 [Methanocorpusculum sp. MCE]